MDGALVVIFIFIGLFYLYKVFRIAGSSIPDKNLQEVEFFKKRIRDDYHYHYYLDGTGYAICVERGKICLVSGNLYDKSNYKVYDRSQIRNISWNKEGYEYLHEYSLHPTAILDNKIRKRDAKLNAYKESGIFIKVTDINHPKWQIRFTDMP